MSCVQSLSQQTGDNSFTIDDLRRFRPNRSECVPIASRSLFLSHKSLLTAGGKNFKSYVMENGVMKEVPGYAIVQGIFIGVVAAFVILVTIVGPEYVYPWFASRLRSLIICCCDATVLGIMLPTLNSTRRRSKKAVDVMMQLWRVTMKRAELRSRRWTKGAQRHDEVWPAMGGGR